MSDELTCICSSHARNECRYSVAATMDYWLLFTNSSFLSDWQLPFISILMTNIINENTNPTKRQPIDLRET
jgi:hypothetical protein